MTQNYKDRADQIATNAAEEHHYALRQLDGEADPYNGADGARTVVELCEYIAELVKIIADC